MGLRAERWAESRAVSSWGSSRVPQPAPLAGVERQTAVEKAFGDFVINGPDTPYKMMDFTYEHQDFDRLVALNRYTVLNNAETVKRALRLALLRRHTGGRTEA